MQETTTSLIAAIASCVIAFIAFITSTIQAYISSRTAKTQVRAYVNIAGIQILDPLERRNARVIVEYKNSGQTPAYNVRAWAGVHVREFPLKSIFVDAPSDLPIGQEVLASGRDARFEVPFSTLNGFEDMELTEGRAAFWVWGEITYRDVFKKAHFTKFRYFCHGDGLPRGSMSPDISGNEAD